MDKKIRHTYKNHTIVLLGKHSYCIFDQDGREVIHASVQQNNMTVKDMEDTIDFYLDLVLKKVVKKQ